MGQYSSLQSRWSKHINIAHIANITHASITECEILAMNDLLLTNGYHLITVKNFSVGRTIVDSFLMLLNRYQQIYWLSDDGKVPEQTYNLYTNMKQAGCLKDRSIEGYMSFFHEEFYGDCLIIECTNELLKTDWYLDFEQALYEVQLSDHMPIVQLI